MPKYLDLELLSTFIIILLKRRSIYKKSKEELEDIRKHIEAIEITGARYPEEQEKLTGQ